MKIRIRKKVLYVFLFLTVVVLAGGYLVLANRLGDRVEKNESSADVSASVVRKSMEGEEGIALIDVRRPDEYATGHLKGSVLLTLETIDAKTAEKAMPDKNKRYYVYCRTGHRSGLAVEALRKLGYSDVHSMGGGITEWQGLGYPVEK